MRIPFLTAEWKDLIVINYEIDPELLKKHIPRGTELDLFDGKAFISIIAFSFNKNKLFGFIPSLPYSFEEVNLRFYIKRNVNGEVRRAVAFISEVVPSRLIAATARLFYNEPYVAHKTRCEIIGQHSLYGWKDFEIKVTKQETLKDLVPGSLEEFILEHYWGYTPQLFGDTVEYRVRHPKWKYWDTSEYKITGDLHTFYDKHFEQALNAKPHSVFIAEGSPISVSTPKRFFHPLSEAKPYGWVLYDGKCGFCSWAVPRLRKIIEKAGYSIAPIQSDWVVKKLNLPDLEKDIRILLSDDILINGADAYIYMMRQIWWLRPLGLFLSFPLFRGITRKIYKFLNKNRFIISKSCGFTPEIND